MHSTLVLAGAATLAQVAMRNGWRTVGGVAVLLRRICQVAINQPSVVGPVDGEPMALELNANAFECVAQLRRQPLRGDKLVPVGPPAAVVFDQHRLESRVVSIGIEPGCRGSENLRPDIARIQTRCQQRPLFEPRGQRGPWRYRCPVRVVAWDRVSYTIYQSFCCSHPAPPPSAIR